jgi:hypothetical protein
MLNRPVRKSRTWLLFFLLVPFIILFPPFYNVKAPEFIGIPFFYWFQLLWIVITAILMAIVYWLKV